MSVIFLERNGRIVPMMVKTGDFLLSDWVYQPWCCDKYELSKLSPSDLKPLLVEGCVTFPKKSNRDQLVELVWEHYDDIFNQMSVKCQLCRRREGPKYKDTSVTTEPLSEDEEDDEEAEEEEESEADSVLSHASADSALHLPVTYLRDPTEFLPDGVFSVFLKVLGDEHPSLLLSQMV